VPFGLGRSSLHSACSSKNRPFPLAEAVKRSHFFPCFYKVTDL
jgi:hypothetical protein